MILSVAPAFTSLRQHICLSITHHSLVTTESRRTVSPPRYMPSFHQKPASSMLAQELDICLDKHGHRNRCSRVCICHNVPNNRKTKGSLETKTFTLSDHHHLHSNPSYLLPQPPSLPQPQEQSLSYPHRIRSHQRMKTLSQDRPSLELLSLSPYTVSRVSMSFLISFLNICWIDSDRSWELAAV